MNTSILSRKHRLNWTNILTYSCVLVFAVCFVIGAVFMLQVKMILVNFTVIVMEGSLK